MPVSGEYIFAGVYMSGGGIINYNFSGYTLLRSIWPFLTISFPLDPKFIKWTDIVLWL